MPLLTHSERAIRLSLVAAALLAGTSAVAGSPEVAFLAENDRAMAKMMAAMKVAPSGDVDADFVAMMVPHHQGAIDMAQAELRYGRNEQLRRMAQEIIVTQQEEIAAMRLAIGQLLAPSQPSRGTTASHTSAAGESAPRASMHSHGDP